MIDGSALELRYDWRSIAELRELYAGKLNDSVLPDISLDDPIVLAEVAAIGVSGGVTAEHILSDSPALVPTAQAVNDALLVALWGPDRKPQESASKKNKNQMMETIARATRLLNPLNWRANSE